MLPQDTVDTSVLPPGERFGMWLDLIARTSAPMRIWSAHAHDFSARAAFLDLGPIQLIKYRQPSLDAVRTPKLIRQSDTELYMLALTNNGVGTASQDGNHSEISAGDFTFYNGSRPHELAHHATEPERELANSIVTMIPHAVLPMPMHRIAPLYSGRLSGRTGVGALVAQFLLQVTAHPEQYDAADASRLGAVGLDLVTTMLGRHLAEDVVPTEVRRRTLFAQVQAYNYGHLGDTTLSPQAVADAHHISVRSLHRLFAAEDATAASYIRQLRLSRCWRDLTDPALRNQTVHAIGARWGFPDRAHFSRVFRAAYGLSPREHRDAGSHLARNVNSAASTVKPQPAD
ncbi:helix-turn-helix domain-containing protein [Micromonospora sp. WMMD1120]|uniref:AraC-like ligand-binding domain-containing protein n=1 Tax=Micromonospora sp. WMMD1120 TaxID=3016106 RepID=UPI002417B002|nr:helix-turn-helix domain-containing protein [Micromonospora sp. WMMD1120]MDG4809114.1 helix-turn-helix domain-containing protein [Micromonospora sp. WMMD1120]